MSHVVKIASIYPTLLGTYGDGGNVAALRHLAALHGIAVQVTEVSPGMTSTVYVAPVLGPNI